MFDTLVLAGGGQKGILHIGALLYLEEQKYLESINTFIGTSIGSIIALLLSCNFNVLKILKHSLSVNIFDNTISLTSFSNELGVVVKNKIFEDIKKMLCKKFKIVPTLKQLYEFTKKEFVCTSVNTTSLKVEYFSYKSDPDLSCLEAIKMSCNIPFIFGKLEYKGNFYVDGGIADNYPIEYACNDDINENINVNMNINENKNKNINKKILGLYFDINDDSSNSKDEMLLLKYFKLNIVPLKEIQRLKLKYCKNCFNVKLTTDINSLKDSSKKEKLKEFISGYNQIKKCFKDNNIKIKIL